MSDNRMLFDLDNSQYPIFSRIDFADPGFINFTLSTDFLLRGALRDVSTYEKESPRNPTGPFGGQKLLYEYTDPNPFKVFHIGHLMSNAIGESLTRLAEFNGAEVKRCNYQGDVGLHIAKALWGIFALFEKNNTSLSDIEKKTLVERVAFLGEAYSLGAGAFEENENAQKEIKELNIQVYIAAQEDLIKNEGWKPVVDYSKFLEGEPKHAYGEVKELYSKGRGWSLEDFEVLYDKLGTKFDYYFFESKVSEFGLDLVTKHLEKGVFEKNQGAVIFKGEDYGLHTRVFINSKGLPVYEAKDLSLPVMKQEIYDYDHSYIITANEINEYFKVVLKAMEQINPDLAAKTVHIGHGVMKFKTGKMSSRTGDVATGKTMLTDAETAVLEKMKASNSTLLEEERAGVAEQLGVGAIKYSILKHNSAKDIIYDQESSISVTGNTGPYLQYTHARASSVLEKAGDWEPSDGFIAIAKDILETNPLMEAEVLLLKHLVHFEEVAQRAAEELSPSTVAEYLSELAQRFNAFYNDVSILGAEDETMKTLRLSMTKQVKVVLRVGLWLLGIEAPEQV